MSFIDIIISVIVPYDCISCGTEGALLCSACQATITAPRPQCYKCLAPSPNGLTCCLQAPLKQVQSAAAYQTVIKNLLWALKSGGAQATVKPMARLLEPYLYAGVTIMPIPTATSRVRQRGYDQSVLLAKELARCKKLPYLSALRRTGQAHQVGADREQRLRQLADAYYVCKSVTGLHIVLVDDVMTTGATLETAARALIRAGAQRVDAITFARA